MNTNKTSIWKLTIISLMCTNLLVACNEKQSPTVGKVPAAHNSEVMGESDTTGGDVTEYSASGLNKELVDTIKRYYVRVPNMIRFYHQFMKFLIASEEGGLSSLLRSNEENLELREYGSLMSREFTKKVYDKLEGGDLLLKNFNKLDLPLVLSTEDCFEDNGNARQGSASGKIYGNRICLSAKKISEDSTLDKIDANIKAIIFHELGHKAGLSEDECKHLEIVWKFMVDQNWNPIYESTQPMEFDSHLGIFSGELQNMLKELKEDSEKFKGMKETEKSLEENLIYITSNFKTAETEEDDYQTLVQKWKIELVNLDLDKEVKPETVIDFLTARRYSREVKAEEIPKVLVKFLKSEEEKIKNFLESNRSNQFSLSKVRFESQQDISMVASVEMDQYEIYLPKEDYNVLKYSIGLTRLLRNLTSTYYQSIKWESFSNQGTYLLNEKIELCDYFKRDIEEHLVQDFCKHNKLELKGLGSGIVESSAMIGEIIETNLQKLISAMANEQKRIDQMTCSFRLPECVENRSLEDQSY